MAMEDVFLLEKNIFLFLFLFLCLCCCCLKLFCVPSGLPQAPFFGWKMTFLKKWYFLKWEKTCFLSKMLKNTTFELLDHHHELNQKKLILLKLFMLRIDSTMLKLWSIPFFSCIFWPLLTFVHFWMSIFFESLIFSRMSNQFLNV